MKMCKLFWQENPNHVWNNNVQMKIILCQNYYLDVYHLFTSSNKVFFLDT